VVKVLAAFVFLTFSIATYVHGQTGVRPWDDTTCVSVNSFLRKGADFRVLTLNKQDFAKFIDSLSSTDSFGLRDSEFRLDVPLPGGGHETIVFRQSGIMPKKLEQKFSHLSFVGIGTNNRSTRATLSITGEVVVISMSNSKDDIFIAPVDSNNDIYVSYKKQDIDLEKVKKSRESLPGQPPRNMKTPKSDR
jgi:hypothetical protein